MVTGVNTGKVTVTVMVMDKIQLCNDEALADMIYSTERPSIEPGWGDGLGDGYGFGDGDGWGCGYGVGCGNDWGDGYGNGRLRCWPNGDGYE